MILAILQARTSSTRLPGKVLKPILGQPLLWRQIERIQRSSKITKIVVATSTASSDDAIEALCREHSVECFRGNLEDVLDRFYQAALFYKPDHIVRLTGDCPLTDPEIIDRVISLHIELMADYTSNAIEPTYPDGLDVELVSFQALKEAWLEARKPSEREHVTAFFQNNPERYRIISVVCGEDYSLLRWTVDEPEDFNFVKAIYEELYEADSFFGMNEILELLKRNPALSLINMGFQRNEGYEKSLQKDREAGE